MEYSFSRMPSNAEITALFHAVGWESAQYPTQLCRAIGNSEAVLTAWENDSLAGMMTAISDGGMNVFFPYLLLDPAFQGKGVGRALAQRMLAHYHGTYRKILVCNADKAPFYEKCGFTCVDDQRPMLRIDAPTE